MRKMRLHPHLKVRDRVEVRVSKDRWLPGALLKAYPRARGQGQWMVRVDETPTRTRFFWEVDIRIPNAQTT